MEIINPRLRDLAARLKDESLIEAEKRELEEKERIRQERLKKEEDEKRLEREALVKKFEYDEKRRLEFRTYVDSLNNFKGNELETLIHSFVSHPDFPRIFNETGTINTARDKWGFLVRKAYEIGNEIDVPLGHYFKSRNVEVKKALEDYGVYLLCPFFRQDETVPTKESCLIDGEPIMSSCGGDYEICVIFQDRAQKSTAGHIQLPKVERKMPKVQVPKIEVELVDLMDLENWWEQEGKYS